MAFDFEFYETPRPFTTWLYRELAERSYRIHGSVCEPCVGNAAIVRAIDLEAPPSAGISWTLNDLDTQWSRADTSFDAAEPGGLWERSFDWTVSNTPFSKAMEIAEQALLASHTGVALHLRASIHEVLKEGPRRTWMTDHLPTGVLWLPRFAYQRSRKTGCWTTDSVCACWVIWIKKSLLSVEAAPQFFAYAPTRVITELREFTPGYRERMDSYLGLTGREKERKQQCIEYWKQQRQAA